MCNYSTVVENYGIEQGETRKAKEIALKLFKRGDSPSEIAELLEYPLAQVKAWLGLAIV